jgi:ATP-grasp domain
MGLAEAGCHVSAVCPKRGHPLIRTRVVQETFPYNSLYPLESLVAAIEKVGPQIIIPSDDRGVQHLHELHTRARVQGASGAALAALIEYSLGPSESYPIVSSRGELLRIAKEEGVLVPDTMSLKSETDLKSWQTDHELPWVLKGDGTFGGKGVRIAETPQDADKFFVEISQLFTAARVIKRAIVNRDPFWLRPWWNHHRPSVSVQSFIKGRPANCAFACWQGELLGVIDAEVVSSEGQTGPADIVRVVKNRDMEFAAEMIARRLCLSGFFGLDFMIEDGTGATYLIELNPRCTPLTHLQLGIGRDLIEALAAKLVDRPVRETQSVTQYDLIAYFPQLWQSKSEFLQSSYHDIPQGEPDLVEDLRRPWPDRSLLYQMVLKISEFATAAKIDRGSAKGAPNV